MGSISFDKATTTATTTTTTSSWLLETFQRRFTPDNSFQLHRAKMELEIPDEKYLTVLSGQIQMMVDGGQELLRPLNKDQGQLIEFPAVQPHRLQHVPQGALNGYWNLSQHAYFTKQVAMNKYLQIEPHRFLTNPSTELQSFLVNKSAMKTPKSNNDASRRSRLKKKIHTELLLESYSADRLESELLDEEEHQLHLIIALLEDMVYEKSGSTRAIECYRNLCCLAP